MIEVTISVVTHKVIHTRVAVCTQQNETKCVHIFGFKNAIIKFNPLVSVILMGITYYYHLER